MTTPATRDAAAAMKRGDFPGAEKILRAEVQAHPGDPWALSLLGVALDNQKKFAEADQFHSRAVAGSPRAGDILNNCGTHFWYAGRYDQAENFFARALAVAPSYFLVLYNLGVMASYTGHYERAREVLEAALRQQPQNVDVLYRLACVDEATRRWEAAAMRLAQAAKLNPRRADVQKLLAVTTTELGALEDAAAAWDRYLKLEPNDETARRERGYTAVKMGKLEQGMADLEWFLDRHPDDPAAHYELGQAERTRDAALAHRHLDKALELDPNYVQARVARGDLFYQEGKPEYAVKDLEMAATLQPGNAANLDRLGQTYQALERTGDAVRVLRRAVELAPEDSKIVLHYGRALAEAGQTEDSKLVMDRFRQLGPEKMKGLPPGLVEYLSLPPAQRRAEYRARVEKAIRDHPDDPATQVEYLKLTIQDGNATQVAGATQRLAAMKPGAQALAEAGHALLDGDYYGLALDLMAGLPESARGSDYYQAQAQMLDDSGKSSDAALAIEQALRLSPDRPELYLLATALLVKQGRTVEALRSIGDGARRLPENREILLMKATTLEFAKQGEEGAQLLKEIQNRWPEWSAAWTAYGMLLATHGRYEEARSALETAAALGSRRPETYFYLADCALRSGPERKAAAEYMIGEALKLSSGDPWIQALAGRIAVENGRYQLAVERLRAAIRQRPQLTEAHKDLARAYRALGRKQEAESELAQVGKMLHGGAEDALPYLRSLLEGRLAREKPPRDQ